MIPAQHPLRRAVLFPPRVARGFFGGFVVAASTCRFRNAPLVMIADVLQRRG